MIFRSWQIWIVVILALLVAACDTASDDGVRRATVDVEYVSEEVTLEIIPSRLSFGPDPWASHGVEFAIATDEWIQHVSVYDRYVVDDGTLVPADSAEKVEYVLSDERDFGGAFAVEVGDLPLGENRVGFSLPVFLEAQPRWEGQLIPHDTVLRVEFVYDVFMAADLLVTFCAEADQMLHSDSVHFDPTAFAQAGGSVLEPAQLAEFEAAAVEYEQEVVSNGHWDPSRLFDLVEEICDVKYDERWQAFS